MSIGENIKKARTNAKLTQQELADAISDKNNSYINTSISNWENDINKPDTEAIASLCKVLNVDANYILGFDETRNKEGPEPNHLEKYRFLLDSDNRLTKEEKELFYKFLEEKHKEIDEKLNK